MLMTEINPNSLYWLPEPKKKKKKQRSFVIFGDESVTSDIFPQIWLP